MGFSFVLIYGFLGLSGWVCLFNLLCMLMRLLGGVCGLLFGLVLALTYDFVCGLCGVLLLWFLRCLWFVINDLVMVVMLMVFII